MASLSHKSIRFQIQFDEQPLYYAWSSLIVRPLEFSVAEPGIDLPIGAKRRLTHQVAVGCYWYFEGRSHFVDGGIDIVHKSANKKVWV